MHEQELHDEARQGEALLMHTEKNRSFVKHAYIESYGCAMNFADSEVVASILQEENIGCTNDTDQADIILINTCSIREKAEERIRKRLTEFRSLKKQKPGLLIGIMGCMAERLKTDLLEEEKLVDIVIGPDAYRTLPRLIEEAETGQKSINVLLSREETYADIAPVRLNSNGINAFVSIMRGCNNMCSFCVVPFTRGRERSRSADSILLECTQLFNDGYREVTLLGQNVDSYYWRDDKTAHQVTFAELMERVALISPLLRVRFSTSHPKDITDDVLFTMKKYDNICNYIHLPVQSGSSRMLQMMNRTYSREWYIAKVNRIKEILPDCGLSTDMITGFCTETEEDHQESMSLMAYCHFDLAYMYFYSERPGTLAARRFEDDVPLAVKKRRLQEMVALHRIHSLESMQAEVGKTFNVLIEGNSKKDENEFYGRNDQNKVVVFPKIPGLKPGDYAMVQVHDCTAGTLLGKVTEKK
jgi:tRNA-2-methylthio-N6-dimethylallyladenosine synthase